MKSAYTDRKHPVHYPPVERWNESVIVFLTVCTARRQRILANEGLHHLLKVAWQSAQAWHVGRYLIMPDHIHLFCSPAARDAENVANWVRYWKSMVTRECTKYRPMWQRHGWDVQIRSQEDFDEKWAYVRQNPVRAGLVDTPEAWPFQGRLHALML